MEKKPEENKEKEVITINSIYADAKKELEDERDKFYSDLEQFQNNIKEKYENFFKRLDDYAEDTASKITEKDKKGLAVFKKKINTIKDLQQKICGSVCKNLEILNLYLTQSEYLYEKYPNSIFINQNLSLILESWIMSEINFKNLGLKSIFDEKNLSKNLKKIINPNIMEEKDLFEIQEPTINVIDTEKSKLDSNSDIFQKMKFVSVKNEHFDRLFNEITSDSPFTELKKIRIKRCLMENFAFRGKFPSLEYIKATNSIFKIEKQPNELFAQLKILTLKNCNLTNNSCLTVLNTLAKSSAKDVIEKLNLHNNKITKIEFDFEVLTKLKELNLENNKLYKLGQFKGQNCALKLLNIIGNNFAFYENFQDLIEQKGQNNKFIVLPSKNLIAFQDDFKKKYLEKLKTALQTIEFPISYLSFEMLFNKFDSNTILSLELNPRIEEGLTFLNISYCGLTDEILSEFLGKTKLTNLRKLNLSSNLLTDQFCKDFCNFKNSFFNLKKLVLTNNERIQGQGYFLNYLHFFEKHHLLKEVHIYRTKFEDNFSNFYNTKKKDLKQLDFVIPENVTEEMMNTDFNCFIAKFNTMFPTRILKLYVKSIFHNSNQFKEFEAKYPKAAKVFEFKVMKKVQE